MDAIANAATKRKRKLTALPLLVVLFVISYLLLTKLVIEQDKTIDSQRSMIHMLFKDNTYLSRLHKHAGELSKKSKSQDDSQLQGQNPASQSASNQESSSQIPLAQVPSSKVGPQANAKSGRRTRKAEKAIPASPPPEPTDPSDQRRVSFSI
jgi:multidrug efflux pump subunit AcrB